MIGEFDMAGIRDITPFYNEIIKLIELNYYQDAIETIKKNINYFDNKDDLALAYLHCGFLNDKLEDYTSAIRDFSDSILHENKLDFLNGRSKDIAFNARSNSRYKNGDFKGSIEDKRLAKKIRLLEGKNASEFNKYKIDYKSILMEKFDISDLDSKFISLIKVSKVKKKKYDLIEDYKKFINREKQNELIKKLESISELKYMSGDFKGSIRAIRRSEKYY